MGGSKSANEGKKKPGMLSPSRRAFSKWPWISPTTKLKFFHQSETARIQASSESRPIRPGSSQVFKRHPRIGKATTVPTLLRMPERREILANPTIFKIEPEGVTRSAHNIVYEAYDIGQGRYWRIG
jgi:hypothetical protein